MAGREPIVLIDGFRRMVPNNFVYQTRRPLFLGACAKHLVEQAAQKMLTASVAVDEQAAFLAQQLSDENESLVHELQVLVA
jgi:hypothetical protein